MKRKRTSAKSKILETDLKSKKPLVLIVDDDASVRLLARTTLEQNDFLVEESEDGAAALTNFKKLKPDVVLLDVMMPEMDGFTVFSKIRGLPHGEFTPVVMMTGLDDVNSINYAFDLGVTDFITKPMNWALLGHRLRYILKASVAFENLKISETKNRAILEAIPDMLFQLNRDGMFLELRGQNKINFPISTNQVLEKKVYEVMPPQLAQLIMDHIEKTLQTGNLQIFEYQSTEKGTRKYYELRLVANDDDKILVIARDVTKQKKAAEQILHLAYHDLLTDLPNRYLFQDRLRQAIATAERKNQSILAVLCLDIDEFKRVNDKLGYKTGDLLLRSVAHRLKENVRKTDTVARFGIEGSKVTLARLDGDEFIILLPELKEVQDAAKVSRRILEILSQPFVIGSHDISITASIGIAVYPIDGKKFDILLGGADIAMYQAKDHGKNTYQFYSYSLNVYTTQRLITENKLRKSLEQNEFQLLYQPQINTSTGELMGIEALIFGVQPDKTLIGPDELIPLAEETGLMVEIGNWLFRSACKQIKVWETTGLEPVRLTVNVSAYQFRQPNFVETICQILDDTKIEPSYLQIELKESTVVQNIDDTMRKLHQLQEIGIQISIDDFGTGYSSINYLKQFYISTVKIAQSFLVDYTNNKPILKAIIALAHSLNLTVVAEGVETMQQLSFLKNYGCDGIQGYLISHPMNNNSLVQFLKEKKYSNLFNFDNYEANIEA